MLEQTQSDISQFQWQGSSCASHSMTCHQKLQDLLVGHVQYLKANMEREKVEINVHRILHNSLRTRTLLKLYSPSPYCLLQPQRSKSKLEGTKEGQMITSS
jgi:hypothetical protein